MGDHAVVFGMEDVMHRGKSDVLVGAPIASHVVGIEKLVVVVAGGIRAVEVAEADLGVAVRDFAIRQSVMRYVVKEGVPGADGTCKTDGIGRVAFDERVVGRPGNSIGAAHNDLGIALRSAQERPY